MLTVGHNPVAPIIIGHPRGKAPPAPKRREPRITWVKG